MPSSLWRCIVRHTHVTLGGVCRCSFGSHGQQLLHSQPLSLFWLRGYQFEPQYGGFRAVNLKILSVPSMCRVRLLTFQHNQYIIQEERLLPSQATINHFSGRACDEWLGFASSPVVFIFNFSSNNSEYGQIEAETVTIEPAMKRPFEQRKKRIENKSDCINQGHRISPYSFRGQQHHEAISNLLISRVTQLSNPMKIPLNPPPSHPKGNLSQSYPHQFHSGQS